jgi:SMC interacting uncharacterized protein involved in chromosome segregation
MTGYQSKKFMAESREPFPHNEREEYEDELDQLSMKYLAAKNRAEKLINGPGGIMEMKQTIADKEDEIVKLRENYSNLLESLKGWK